MSKDKQLEITKYAIEPGSAALLMKINDEGEIHALILESQVMEEPEKSAFVVDTLRALLFILTTKPDDVIDAYHEMTETNFVEENESETPFEGGFEEEPDDDTPEWARKMKGNA